MKEYIVGSEMRLKEILTPSDVIPLLKAMVKTGVRFASVTDADGRSLWCDGDSSSYTADILSSLPHKMAAGRCEGDDWRSSPLYYEGEPVGFLFAAIPDLTNKGFLVRLIEIVSVSLNVVIRNNVKRIITTELHDTFTYRSYEELLEANKKLSISEQKYRELAQNLEQRVEEKTSELKKATARLLEQEKMAAIGQLAAGIAHEINNPISFIYSNINTFSRYIRSLKEMLQLYRQLFKDITEMDSLSVIGNQRSAISGQQSAASHQLSTISSLQSVICNPQSAISNPCLQSEELYKRLKIDFILKDVFDLIQQSVEGAERIRQIVANLKDFSHIDETATGVMDINAEIEKTLNVLSHEIKGRSARIIKDYGQLPRFFGNPAHLCQVFFNIVLNAIQAGEEGIVITINTAQDKDNIVVSIADNGQGIPAEIQNRIFEPFFTTKDVGKGTGMGLAVAYEVVSNHGGSIEVKSSVGNGANFIITLPLNR